jgi:DNA polymerase
MAGAVGAEWAALSREIRGCVLCPLHRTRTRTVIYRGGEHPWVVFIGEAPGKAEDLAGAPFVGRAGAKLDAGIARLGLGPTEFGIVNVLKCRPPANRFAVEPARSCRPYLERQLALLRPQVVVTLGRWALRSMDPGAPPIMTAAGIPRPVGGWEVYPLLHPAAIRSRATAHRWERDLGTLAQWLNEQRR